jgi:hypothetical protein
VYQVLRLVAEDPLEASSSISSGWLESVLSIGAYDLVPRLLAPSAADASVRDQAEVTFCLGQTFSSHLEGILFFLGKYLSEYLDALRRLEVRHYREHLRTGKAWFHWRDQVPSVEDLSGITGDMPGDDRERQRWHIFSLKAVFYAHDFIHQYLPIQYLLPVYFYVDSDSYRTRTGKKLMRLAKRYLAYWRLRDLRHRFAFGDAPFTREEWDRLASVDLTRRAVGLWHRYRDRPEELLRRCRILLARQPASRWSREFADERRRPFACQRLLPLWLLEVRALRLFGRGSPQWDEANQLARERFACLAYPELIDSYASGSVEVVLPALEALRQLAVARGADPQLDDFWDRELLRSARTLLVRLEAIPDHAVRRRLSGFLRPILTAVAGCLAEKPATVGDAFCLFEQARSRWLLDHLSLGDRTLGIAEGDPSAVRALKDRLFDALNPVVGQGEPMVLRPIPEVLWQELGRTDPDLARLVTAYWPDLKRVSASIPADATLLAYHVEDDPAEPPQIRLDASLAPWPAAPPGANARLWMFQVRDGACQARICARPAKDVMQHARLLGSISQSARGTEAGQPTLDWRDPRLRQQYEGVLAELAGWLVRSWEETAAWTATPFPLLILPCGELFGLPWPALPLRRGGRLLDAAILGLLPGLGPALWLGTAPDRDRPVSRAEVFVRRAPRSPGGLQLPDALVHRLRHEPFRLTEGAHATPERALQAFGESDCLIFLCHGQGGDRPGLELARTAQHPTGRLTVTDLEGMPPETRARVLVLGACWSGLEARQAAEDVEGLTGILFLKGVQAVLAGLGWVPVPLIEVAVDAVIRGLGKGGASAELAQQFRHDLLRFRARFGGTADGASPCWSSFLFHGVPWPAPSGIRSQ